MVLRYTLSIHEINMGKVSCLILKDYQGPMYPKPLCGSKESRGQENMVVQKKFSAMSSLSKMSWYPSEWRTEGWVRMNRLSLRNN